MESHKYRTDIDGLRATAVLSVIAFYGSIVPGGFSGGDVFFVISGNLIASERSLRARSACSASTIVAFGAISPI
ncbi:peptidoglycan/LPS O-acetylase OafA/YrhL [Bradyrhizobium sp. USDA 4341]